LSAYYHAYFIDNNDFNESEQWTIHLTNFCDNGSNVEIDILKAVWTVVPFIATAALPVEAQAIIYALQ